MNKKGVIEYIFVVAFALALAAFAILSLLSMSNNKQTNADEIKKLLEQRETPYAYVLGVANFSLKKAVQESNGNQDLIRTNFQEIVALHDSALEGTGNFFAKVRNGDFEINFKESAYQLKITGLFTQASSGSNVFKRRFDLLLELGSSSPAS